MPDATRITDAHTCPAHTGGPITGPGATTVRIGSLIGSHATDAAVCVGLIDSILLGSPSVYSGGKMAVRIGDPSQHVGAVSTGLSTVQIGGPTATVTLSGGVMTVTWGGMTITGSVDDVTKFSQLLNNDLGRTNAGKRLLAKVVNDSSHATSYNIGRNQPGVLIDAFNTNEVDLDDIEKFPTTPDPAHPDQVTSGEVLSHVLGERRDAAVNGHAFGQAHQAGLATQNDIRGELGQSLNTGTNQSHQNPDGTVSIPLPHANGTQDEIIYDPTTGEIVNVLPP